MPSSGNQSGSQTKVQTRYSIFIIDFREGNRDLIRRLKETNYQSKDQSSIGEWVYEDLQEDFEDDQMVMRQTTRGTSLRSDSKEFTSKVRIDDLIRSKRNEKSNANERVNSSYNQLVEYFDRKNSKSQVTSIEKNQKNKSEAFTIPPSQKKWSMKETVGSPRNYSLDYISEGSKDWVEFKKRQQKKIHLRNLSKIKVDEANEKCEQLFKNYLSKPCDPNCIRLKEKYIASNMNLYEFYIKEKELKRNVLQYMEQQVNKHTELDPDLINDSLNRKNMLQSRVKALMESRLKEKRERTDSLGQSKWEIELEDDSFEEELETAKKKKKPQKRFSKMFQPIRSAFAQSGIAQIGLISSLLVDPEQFNALKNIDGPKLLREYPEIEELSSMEENSVESGEPDRKLIKKPKKNPTTTYQEKIDVKQKKKPVKYRLADTLSIVPSYFDEKEGQYISYWMTCIQKCLDQNDLSKMQNIGYFSAYGEKFDLENFSIRKYAEFIQCNSSRVPGGVHDHGENPSVHQVRHGPRGRPVLEPQAHEG